MGQKANASAQNRRAVVSLRSGHLAVLPSKGAGDYLLSVGRAQELMGKTGEMEVAMKTSVMVLVVLLIVTGGVLAVMNNACKTSHHSWCAPGHLSVIPHPKSGAS